MAPSENLRQVLVEIPNPQPKIAVHLRRSYEEILNSTRVQTRLTTLHANVPPMSFLRRENEPTAQDISEVTSLTRRNFGARRGMCINSSTFISNKKTLENDSEKELPFKKQRLHFKPGVNLEVKLDDLLTSQLVHTLLLHRYPAIDDEDMKLVLPSLILKCAQKQLELSKSNVYRSIPRWRLGSNRDAYCYRKAHNHLQAFKRTCLEQGKLLLQAGCWETSLNYILIAWRITSELPQWDNSFHNECTQQCFTVLAVQGTTALQKSCLELDKYKQLRKRLRIAYTQNKLIKPCLEELDRIIVVLECSPSEQIPSCLNA
ncbi:uncharacterized protein LOC127569437 isoform X2 [Pristis pectinata]|uniref:uncharacterized protein LOC127569437 isoform X2 n=1 Tax=Pristis pectinata TaxID=685728 RepID=UPI00223D94B7|nr:uncharacterized protein LOC127569437 isoform X2 [Pristis pectinata]